MIYRKLIIVATLLISACSTGNLYEGFRQSAVDNCSRMELSDRERCLTKVTPQKYEEYKREIQ